MSTLIASPTESIAVHQPTDYAQAIATLLVNMPPEQAVQVYNFARFLQTQPLFPPPALTVADDDWLNDSEEQMQAEDDLWAVAHLRQRDQFAALAAAARAEIVAGTTKPLFNERGEMALS